MHRPFISSRSLLLWVLLLLSVGLIADWQRWVPDALIGKAGQEYGKEAASRIKDWQQMMRQAADKEEGEQLRIVNDFFNQNIRFVNDDQHWGEVDYWATPYEALGSNGADCEDYVIAKYYSLRQLGVDTQKLRITYVKALRYNQAHMVLSYFPTADAVPYVLDNLVSSIHPASQRRDLSPVYSFNGEGMWLERLKGEGIRMGNPNKLDLWTNLRIRMNDLGLDL
ncbi:transglutaminase-like cysteine peptidase [Bacterioplanoides sp.]|uniref:transglutaminase-like cysteine peptidase n=1 Tax=Bacterioplanoides sp. TaxID=2066072 RepID=UPI003AFF9A04